METAAAAGVRGAVVTGPMRRQLIEFLIGSCLRLGVPSVVKYTALSLFADRFLRVISSSTQINTAGFSLLDPSTESSLQLFALISIWVSSKLHDLQPLSVQTLKSFGENLIQDQLFTRRDFAEAELAFLEVLQFEIGASNIVFNLLEELLFQFRQISSVGELLSSDVCLSIIDLLYESEETSICDHSPCYVAASILVTSYVLSVPKQQWEFPLLPWVRAVTSYEEEDIRQLVETILRHIFNTGKAQQKEEAVLSRCTGTALAIVPANFAALRRVQF